MTPEGTVVSRPVHVIQEIQDTVFIRADMASSPRIVLSDLPVMTEGMEVRVDGLDDPTIRTAQTGNDSDRNGSMAAGGGTQ